MAASKYFVLRVDVLEAEAKIWALKDLSKFDKG